MSAILFIDTDYVMSHGKNPRGFGSWAFCTVDPNRHDYLDHVIWVHQSTFAKAKKTAKEQAKSRNIDTLWVCA